MNRITLGAYWGIRKESIEECADRLARFFADLSACDEAFTKWYEPANSRRQALERRAAVRDRRYLLESLARLRIRTEVDPRPIEELGYQLRLWNGRSGKRSAALGIFCGGYSRWGSNCVVLDLPEDLGNLKEVEGMRRLLAAIVRAWEPDSTSLMSDEATAIWEINSKAPYVDWILYLSDRLLPQVPSFDPPSSTERLDDIGTILVVQEERPDYSKPEDRQRVERVRQVLAGALRLPSDESEPRPAAKRKAGKKETPRRP